MDAAVDVLSDIVDGMDSGWDGMAGWLLRSPAFP